MVVMQKISKDFGMLIYTDSRSPKVEELRKQNMASILFWHPKKRIQIRVTCEITIMDSSTPEYERHARLASSMPNASDYKTARPPGTAIDEVGDTTEAESFNFAVLQAKPIQFDILKLSRQGHIRSIVEYEDGFWHATAVVP